MVYFGQLVDKYDQLLNQLSVIIQIYPHKKNEYCAKNELLLVF
jgi:hypothetical protein